MGISLGTAPHAARTVELISASLGQRSTMGCCAPWRNLAACPGQAPCPAWESDGQATLAGCICCLK